MAKRTLLIPALLDDWFPLLQYIFASERWSPVLLMESEGRLTHLLKKFSPALVDRLFYWAMSRESNTPLK